MVSPRYVPVVDLHSGRVVGADAGVAATAPAPIAPAGTVLTAAPSRLWSMTPAVAREVRNWPGDAWCTLPATVDDIRLLLRRDTWGLDTPVEAATALLTIADRVVLRIVEPGHLTRALLDRVRGLGLRVALENSTWPADSVGARCSSAFVRIGPALIGSIDRDTAAQQRLARILNWADEIGAIPVAHGLERASQLAPLRDLGCPFGQGPVLAAELPGARFASML